MRAIVEAGVPEEGLLTDVEHVSVAVTGPRDSRAYGWVRELAALPTEEGLQLCARIEWTPLGLPLVRDRIYKHFRPCTAWSCARTWEADASAPCNSSGWP